MRFVSPPTQNPQQSMQQQQQQQLHQPYHSLQQPSHQNSNSSSNVAVNSNSAMNGPSSLNSTNHAPQGMSSGMSSFSGASASPLLPATLDAAGNAADAGGMTSTNDASGDAASSASFSGGSGSGGAASGMSQLDPHAIVLSKKRLQDLVKEIDPMEVLDDDVEDVLLQIADDFIENVVTSGCMMAKHRKSSTLEVKDVQLHLQRNWNMWIPGFGGEELRPYKKAPVTDAHKQRLALIKKTLKKF